MSKKANNSSDPNPLAEMVAKIAQLAEEGYSGDELLDKALEDWGKNGRELGLHDFFNVSDEEEASWYDEKSKKVRTFKDLLNILEEEHTLDATKGYVRKGIRRQRAECRVFFLDWIKKVQNLISEIQLGDENTLSIGTLTTFTTVCYFAAETHDTAFFYPILECMKALHFHATDDDDTEYTPLSTFVYQALCNILYATCDNDFQQIMTYLVDEELDEEIQNELCKVLAQLAADGVFSEEEERKMINQYFQFLEEWGGTGDALAHWIVRSGKSKTEKKKLQILLEDYIDPMFYGTTNIKEFEKMVTERNEPLCKSGTVMDDMILFGMYPKAIHAPEDIREKAVAAQHDRIKKMKQHDPIGD